MRKVSIILPYYNRKELILRTLKSLEDFYQNENVEIIIVDDVSDNEHRLEGELTFNLDIKLIRLEVKNGVNPCYPYNVGVRESKGDILILSSPETFHTTNMYSISNNFNNLTDDNYILFSVFCLTDLSIIDKIDVERFFDNLGENGYQFNNNYGSWYTHSEYRPSGLNFFTAITRNKFYEMSGFDERFRFGTGYDDNEFKDRLVESNTEFIYIDGAIAIHVNHEVINNMPPTTNLEIYTNSKVDKYKKNDLWGKH